MSNMKDLAIRAESIGICAVCYEPTDEMVAPLVDLYGVNFPPCRECGDHAVYTVTEILENPAMRDRRMVSVIDELGFPIPEKTYIVKM